MDANEMKERRRKRIGGDVQCQILEEYRRRLAQPQSQTKSYDYQNENEKTKEEEEPEKRDWANERVWRKRDTHMKKLKKALKKRTEPKQTRWSRQTMQSR